MNKKNKNKYKGIVLAGGLGTRLAPLTSVISKQLLPIYDKPMIFYSLSVLMLAGIRDICIISDTQNRGLYEKLLGDGSRLGINICYKIQNKPSGIAEALIIGEDFIGNDSCLLILGDNIFYGQSFTNLLKESLKKNLGATVFTYPVNNPANFGILECDKNNKPIAILEKPKKSNSRLAVTGLYVFENDCIRHAKKIKPSKRGELEITSVLNQYLKQDKLAAMFLGRGFAWLDTGTHDSLLEAGLFVKTIESRQGTKIACLEEIAFQNKWINGEQLKEQIPLYKNSPYGNYLKTLAKTLI